MFTDFTAPATAPQVITFPDVTYTQKPGNPDDLKTVVYLTGSEANPPGAVTGSIEVRH